MVWLIYVQAKCDQVFHDSRLFVVFLDSSNLDQKRVALVIWGQRIKAETYQIVQAIGVIATTMQESSAVEVPRIEASA